MVAKANCLPVSSKRFTATCVDAPSVDLDTSQWCWQAATWGKWVMASTCWVCGADEMSFMARPIWAATSPLTPVDFVQDDHRGGLQLAKTLFKESMNLDRSPPLATFVRGSKLDPGCLKTKCPVQMCPNVVAHSFRSAIPFWREASSMHAAREDAGGHVLRRLHPLFCQHLASGMRGLEGL